MVSSADSFALPAIYIGTQPGFRNIPAIELYNLLVPVGEHPVGSTVSRTTLERHGWVMPKLSRRQRRGPGAKPRRVAVVSLDRN